MPKFRPYSNDRVPTIEEVRKLCEYPDRRIKAIVYTMASSGIRIGAWDYLRWEHVIPIKDEKTGSGEIVAAKLIVYASEPEEYFSFITPEAYHALKAYMDFHALWGEKITGESWLMRDYFRTADVKRSPNKHGNMRGGATGVPKRPKLFTSRAMNRMLLRALYEQGLRETLQEGSRRHEFKTAHSYRKYFKTRAEQVMNRLNVEYLLGHSVGLNSNYYKPTYQELLTDYLKAVPSLTINEYNNVEQLKEQQENLEKRQEDKDQEIQELREEQAKMREMIASSMRAMASMTKMFTSVEPKEGATIPNEKLDDWVRDTTCMMKAYIKLEGGEEGKGEEK
jgi:hypothetical protein